MDSIIAAIVMVIVAAAVIALGIALAPFILTILGVLFAGAVVVYLFSLISAGDKSNGKPGQLDTRWFKGIKACSDPNCAECLANK